MAVGCCENSQAEYYEEHTRLLKAGAQPVLIEAIEAQVGLATNQPKLKVFVISEHGELVRRLPTEYVDGRLLLFHRITAGVVSIHHVLSDPHIALAVGKNKPRPSPYVMGDYEGFTENHWQLISAGKTRKINWYKPFPFCV